MDWTDGETHLTHS